MRKREKDVQTEDERCVTLYCMSKYLTVEELLLADETLINNSLTPLASRLLRARRRWLSHMLIVAIPMDTALYFGPRSGSSLYPFAHGGSVTFMAPR